MNSKIILVIGTLFCLILNYFYASQLLLSNRIITVIDRNRTYNIKSSYDVIEDILFDNNITLSDYDIVEPPLKSKISSDRIIQISRVSEVLSTEFISIPKHVQLFRTSKLPFNKEIVLDEGSDGMLKRVSKIIKVDNVIVEQDIIEERTYIEPVNKRIVRGTNRRITYIERYPKAKARLLYARLSAYTPGPESCAPYDDGITSIGLRAGYGIAAVDPRIIPIGSTIYIPGYGYALAADVGGAIKGHRIDLCFYKVTVAREFGIRYQNVYVIN